MVELEANGPKPMYQAALLDKGRDSISSPTEYTGAFPKELPPRPLPTKTPWKVRLRAFWTFRLSSYSITHTPNCAARIRHISMVTILVLRAAMSGLSILSAALKGSVGGIVLYSLLAVLGTWLNASCLAIIGDAEGAKPLGRLTVKRWHFDVFLGVCVIIHTVFIVVYFFGLTGWGLEVGSIGMWLAILFTAWVAERKPKIEAGERVWVT